MHVPDRRREGDRVALEREEARLGAPARRHEPHQLERMPAKRRRERLLVELVDRRAREPRQLGAQLGLLARLEEPRRTPEARRIALHDAGEQDVPADRLARDVRTSHLAARAVEDVLQGQRAPRLDGEHAVEAEPRSGDPRRRFPLGRRQLGTRGVALRRCATARELAVLVEPGGEDLEVAVVHHALRADELLERCADLVAELLRRPVLNAAPDRVVEPRLAHGSLLVGETAALVLAPAAARARRVPRDRRAAHARVTVIAAPDGPLSTEALILSSWRSTHRSCGTAGSAGATFARTSHRPGSTSRRSSPSW